MPEYELNREIFLAPKWQLVLIIKDLHSRIFLSVASGSKTSKNGELKNGELKPR